MKKFTNILMLGIWIFQLVFGIVNIVNGTNINPWIFICAVIICIIHYIQEIFNT